MTDDDDDRYVFDIVEIRQVVDGDTYRAVLEERLAFYETRRILLEIRLDGVDCPEKRQGSVFERAEGRHAEIVAREWLTSGRRLRCRTRKPGPDTPPIPDGGFGRWLGDIWDADSGEHLADHLRSLGLASVWPERWRQVYDVIPSATT